MRTTSPDASRASISSSTGRAVEASDTVVTEIGRGPAFAATRDAVASIGATVTGRSLISLLRSRPWVVARSGDGGRPTTWVTGVSVVAVGVAAGPPGTRVRTRLGPLARRGRLSPTMTS